MKGVRIDPEKRIARVQGGCSWGDFDHAAHSFGLATTGGIISTTGVAGLTLGGGIGYLARAHGLSIDNLRSADVVLADGSFVIASEAEHPDLFWALRGGGGNFGVVTELEFDLHPVDTIYGGPMFFELEVAGGAVQDLWQLDRRSTTLDGRVPGLPDRPAAALHPRGPGRRAARAAGVVFQRQ